MDCIVKEQTLEDEVTGLRFQFKSCPAGGFVMRVFGKQLPHGNRDIFFDEDGLECGSGTALGGPMKPIDTDDLGDPGDLGLGQQVP